MSDTFAVTDALDRKIRDTVDRGISWVEGSLASDGSFKGSENDLAAYYKSLLALAITGRIEAGARCLSFVRRHFSQEDGDLAADDFKTSLQRMQRNLANYMDGWVAIGAWLLGDYRLANSVCRFLLGQQSAVHGGVLTGPQRWSGRPRYDLATAASCGRAFLIVGYRDAAASAADFLVNALAHQHEENNSVNLSFDEEWRPLKEPDPSVRTYYSLDLEARGEKVWFAAFSCGFLCELYQVASENRYLDAAQRYFALIERLPEFADESLANGKSAWAASLLARATSDERYLEAFHWIVPNVLSRQQSDGEFGSADLRQDSGHTQPTTAELPRRLERTAEFTTWTAEFARMRAGFEELLRS